METVYKEEATIVLQIDQHVFGTLYLKETVNIHIEVYRRKRSPHT